MMRFLFASQSSPSPQKPFGMVFNSAARQKAETSDGGVEKSTKDFWEAAIEWLYLLDAGLVQVAPVEA